MSIVSGPARTIVRTGGAVALGAATTWVTRAAWGLPVALGARPGALRAAATGSPQFQDGKFVNAESSPVLPPGTGASILRQVLSRGDRGRPHGQVPLARSGRVPEAAADLAATWYGHSSALVEVDGQRVLLDPVWGHRVSPSPLVGPRRMHPVPVPIEELPAVDAILISHDHYDHLD
ncbi:MAG: MBL fold metallo-hydrolase, partial [Actinomycetota bacterium]|nr:MBL fold metallo-hydrolase [Actinomycetota bacterium]